MMFYSDFFNAMVGHIGSGGIVMAPLICVSVLMWVLILVKLSEFYGLRSEESLTACMEKRREADTIRVLWQRKIIGLFINDCSYGSERDIKRLESFVKRQERWIWRHIGTIMILASIAPLLGLLGTVSGMINTFEAISRFGTGNAMALGSGISKALITTQSGLMISIPGLFMGNFLSRRAEKLEDRMKTFVFGLLNEKRGCL